MTQGTSRPAGAGKKDGYIQVYISGGVTPYTVRWYDQSNKSVTPENLVEVSPNLYMPKAYGVLTAHAEGGIPNTSGPPYIYRWLKNDVLVSITEDTFLITGAGKYQVVAIDANGVEALSEIYELGQPDSLSLSFSASDLRCSHDTNGWAELIPPTCYNGSDGKIQLQLSGGQAPYYHYWENDDRALTRTGLPAGDYTFTVTDINGCGYELKHYRLEHPDSIIVDLGEDRLLCKDQSHVLTARISEPFRSYTWYNPSGKVIATGETVALFDPGIYRAEVITAKGCRGEGTVAIRRDGREIASDFVAAT